MPSLDLDLVPSLREALDHESLVLHFQPEVDLATGAVVGMEALLRWQHPQRGLLWPADFLAVAEGAGLLPQLGWWVLGRSAVEPENWRPLPPAPEGTRRQMWMNISASQLLERDFVDRVARTIAESALAP